ncbi:MAG: hypothetical protein ABI123_04185 [Ginsengibacter sp.]|jgi:hypothetical protein
MNNYGETAKEKLQMIANTSDLSTAIKRLEVQRAIQEDDLKDHFHVVLESLKPKNILKHTIAEVQESTQLKHNLLKVALGLGAGYFSRKMIVGQSAGIVKKALGAVLQYGITNFVARKNTDPNVIEYAPKKKSLFKRVLSLVK